MPITTKPMERSSTRGWPIPPEMNPFAPKDAMDAMEEIIEAHRAGAFSETTESRKAGWCDVPQKVRPTKEVDKIASEKTLRKLLEKEGITIGSAAKRLGLDCRSVSFRAKKYGIVYRDQHGKTHYPPSDYKERQAKAEAEKKRIQEAVKRIILGEKIRAVAGQIGVTYAKLYKAVCAANINVKTCAA